MVSLKILPRASAESWTTAPMCTRHVLPGSPLNRLALVMLTVGMAASLWLSFETTKTRLQQPDLSSFRNFVEHRSGSFHIAHGLHLAFLLPAGLFAWLAFRPKADQPDPTASLLLFFVAVGIMTYRGYSMGDLLSTKFVGATGPVPCMMSMLIFVGAQRHNWAFLRRLIGALAIVLAAIVVLVSLSTVLYTRNQAVASLGIYLNALFFPAAWLLLDHHPNSHTPTILRWTPVIIYAAGTVLVQTRLNVIMILALVSGYIYLQNKRGRGLFVISGIAYASVVLALFLMLLSDSVVGQSLSRSADLFRARMNDDSRTGQLVYFFRDLQPAELILGRGAQAVWTWGPLRWTGGTDVGYLSLMLFGGIPLLLTYYLVHLARAFCCARNPGASSHAACAIIVLLWALRMFSSSYPSFTIDYYVVLLCVGGCFAWPRMRPLTRTVRGAALV
jgi:hypothetical protein